MLVLSIDTATTDLVTGVVDTESGAVSERIITDTRAHNEQLIPTIQRLLEEKGMGFADLDAIVVGCGPGPFTGLRVGMATASALGDALGIPVHGVCSHDAIAAEHGADRRILVATDARRKEIYWATYAEGVRVEGPGLVKPGEIAVEVEAVVIPGNLVEKLPEALQALPHVAANPRPAGLVAVADLSATPAPLTPLYLRRPDAVPPKPKPRSAALPDISGLSL
ncbi:tRNA threonylcarbamoyladenosine biosynthesis protein TsaB [Corynebacterium sp. HMSC036D03]|uniref:tRNA (adenosine(37)-N6)-threonylcarbamoyltransferase complex dimerization subunit type 1 TsaB n=1 Tax=Corynebacterium sp. HMSC036D03 TaxID=1715171 RepID=UPI0008A82E5E|nr:tRNA (adenosine(37)-N6)-threonylcarbamoyltransferase complex dimerization subunit type 1 TsaB [Corynebacterium sp. HMSC036D03]OHO67661.1 tRNA threonylcarbamoyladenosine biosynthesis protein TsaB [Corynebacterium sp. HMSC036D03]